MHITVWNDYICPWAYAARPQTAWLRAQVSEAGLSPDCVTVRSFELHPDIPPEGRIHRPGGRLDQVLDHIATECASRGQAFHKPPRTPNSHAVLALAELVSTRYPDAFVAFDDAVAEAHWVHGEAIDDPAVIREILRSLDLDAGALTDDEAVAEGDRLLAEARTAAMDVGATATPAWQIGDLVVAGLHEDAQFQRWVGRILHQST